MSDFLSGIDGVTARIQKARTDAAKGARRGMLVALRNVLNVSNAQVPHEEGDLERDGGISVDDATLRGAVSYGRSADTKDYAVPQHERMDYKHDSGRNAKFLENALNSTRQQSLEIMGREIRDEMGT